MKKFILIILSCLMLCSTLYGQNVFNPNTVTSNDIINYINNVGSNKPKTAYCIDRDKIDYYMTFLDEERDYYNLAFPQHLTPNSSLPESNKQINPVNLKVKYEHNPNVYDNPVRVSSITGKWYDITVKWDAAQNKWTLVDPSKSILFTTPTDDKRGEWTISIKGTDTTGKPVFDKESVGTAKFRVHKAPIPMFNFIDQGTSATLTDAGSYDVDYQYSKPNNGIKNYYWSAKIGDNWVDLGTGKTVTFNKNGQTVSDYRLTVEDYDGAFASIAKSSLILDKPIADFEFRINGYTGDTIQYAYKGNVSNERIYVYPTISWNDEAYHPGIYNTSGTRTEKWVSLNTLEERNNYDLFSNDILYKRFSENVKNNFIKVLLEIKNKYDLVHSTNKSLAIRNIELQDLTSTGYVHANCGFEVGKTATIKIKVTNSSYLNDLDFKVDIPSLNISNMQLEPTASDKSILTATIPLDSRNSYWNPKQYKFDYSIKVYSKRTETSKVLHQVPGTALIHTPLDLDPFINDQKENIVINADENTKFSATTKEYAESVTVSVPLTLTDPATNQKFMPNTAIPLYPKDNNTKWERVLTVDADSLTDEQNTTAKFDAISFNKRDTDTQYLNFKTVAYKLMNFRVVKVRDLKLEDYYKNYGTGAYDDKAMFVNDMAIDALSFQPYPISYLTKGYVFEFEIDSINFNGENDTIVIQPSLYSITGSNRDPQAKEGYWIDSNKKIWQIGTGGHRKYGTIVLTKNNRTITSPNRATWKGQYYIPGTTFLTNPGNSTATAKSNDLKSDIIVHFNIEGLKNSTPKFNYNRKQWGLERTTSKFPYEIGDVIRYKGDASNLDDLQVNRTQ